VQGVGSYGSFGELSGWKMNSENLSEFEMPVSDGKIYIRITNTSTGQVSREEIDVDASIDTLTSIAAKISALSGLSATVASSRIVIQAEPGYKFDFSPAVLPEPTASNLTAASPPEISVTGEYEGDTNQTFVCTVVSGGFVGNDVVQIEVRNGAGELVKTLNVGAGYAAGDYVEMADGVRVSLGQGQLNAGDSFEVAVLSNTDTSGFLAATGLNCFFAGSGASDISVMEQITEQPSRIASSAGPEMTDNVNAMRMFALRNTSLSSLGDVTIGDFYRDLVTGIGLETAVKQAGSDSMEGILKELKNRQSEMSGVDINEEAAQLLIFEKMFQAMAKYISTVQSTLSSLMEII
jgi:flagellar hook-associated protein 1 FlgK